MPIRYPLPAAIRQECALKSMVQITSKRQITVPKSVRDALKLRDRDERPFRVERSRANRATTLRVRGIFRRVDRRHGYQ